MRPLQNPNELLCVAVGLHHIVIKKLTLPLCFFFLRRAEKTEVLSDDLLQVNIPQLTLAHAKLHCYRFSTKLTNMYILLDKKTG